MTVRVFGLDVQIASVCSFLDCSVTGAGKKKNVNVGSKGGSAGLDDYKYDDVLDGDDEFM